MAKRRANATMPTRRMRVPPATKRRLNHWVKALSGCNRSQLPCEFDKQGPRSLVAGLADALLDLAGAAVVRGGCQPKAAGQLAPVGEAQPAEQLLDQYPGALGADRAQLASCATIGCLPSS